MDQITGWMRLAENIRGCYYIICDTRSITPVWRNQEEIYFTEVDKFWLVNNQNKL